MLQCMEADLCIFAAEFLKSLRIRMVVERGRRRWWRGRLSSAGSLGRHTVIHRSVSASTLEIVIPAMD